MSAIYHQMTALQTCYHLRCLTRISGGNTDMIYDMSLLFSSKQRQFAALSNQINYDR